METNARGFSLSETHEDNWTEEQELWAAVIRNAIVDIRLSALWQLPELKIWFFCSEEEHSFEWIMENAFPDMPEVAKEAILARAEAEFDARENRAFDADFQSAIEKVKTAADAGVYLTLATIQSLTGLARRDSVVVLHALKNANHIMRQNKRWVSRLAQGLGVQQCMFGD